MDEHRGTQFISHLCSSKAALRWETPCENVEAHPELYMRAIETWPSTIELVPQEALTLEMYEKALAGDPSLAECLPDDISTRLKAENFSPTP